MTRQVFIVFLLLLLAAPAAAVTWPLYVRVWNVCPASYPSYLVNDNYYLRVTRDSVDMSLPYMGRVYQPVYGNGPSLTFKAPITELEEKAGKKQRVILRFNTRNGGVNYRLRMELEPSGKVDIRLMPSNAQSIRYDGDITEP